MTEKAEISKIETEDEFIARAKDILDEVKNIDPANLQSLLLCAVTKDKKVKVGIAAQTPSNPSNEATH